MARARFTLLAFVACVCASALPAPAAASACANADATPQPGNLGQVRAAVLCLIDQERERHGESALQPNAKLTRAAEGHSRDMAAEDYFSHVAPNGETPLDRMRASGYLANPQVGYVVGENIAWGTLWLATPQAIVNAWMASPGHRANILDAAYRDTGVGVAPHPPASLAEGQAGAIYTQDFGAVVPAGHSSRRSAGSSAAPPPRGRSAHGSAGRHPPLGSPRHSTGHPGRITSAPQTSERSNTYHGSSRRQSRHRHRVRARHRARHRRAARRARRARAHQRSRRRRRQAGR
ncbi:MAG: CAP domain-containing protein [Solirubrobacteraceae bacterium]